MEAEGRAAECLNQCLQKLLGQYYDKIEGTFSLYLCEFVEDKMYKEEEGKKWICLTNDKKIRERVEKFFASEIQLMYMPGDILYVSDEKRIENSNSIIGGTKTIRLIFLGERENQPIRLLAEILSNELLLRLNDMLFLETIRDKIESIHIDTGNLEKDKFCCYFFGNLLDKDWISKEYVKHALAEERLPDWKTFLQLSSMFYEKRTIKTSLYFVDNINDIRKCDLKFSNNDIRIQTGEATDFRMLCKLMELSGTEHSLAILRPGFEVIAIVDKPDENNDCTCVEFMDHMVWRLKKGKKVLLQYQKGVYKLPELESSDDSEKEIDKINVILKDILEEHLINEFVHFVKKVKELAIHGTTLIFMDKDTLKSEIERLVSCHRAISVEPFNLPAELETVKNIFSIDGAVLLDFSCECRAIGAIVDGKAYPNQEGKARGARYNSISGYVKGLRNSDEKYKNAYCMAVIFSEDKMVNVIENGVKQIGKRSRGLFIKHQKKHNQAT